MSQEFSEPPPGVDIQVVKSSADQLVIAVPPGGKKARGLGCFGFIWMAIVVPVSSVFILTDDADWDGGNAPSLFVLIPFFGLFWAVGIGMIIAWVRMRFTKLFLSVEREQFAIQKTLFGRKKLKKIQLDEKSHAKLIESYSENDVPVSAIQMEGIGQPENFATGLSYEEKRWLANTINQFLGTSGRAVNDRTDTGSLPTFCGDCGGELMIGDGKHVCPDCGRVYLEGENDNAFEIDPVSRRDRAAAIALRGAAGKITERPPALNPYELPADSDIRIDLDDGETLTFSYRVQIPFLVKIILGGFLSFFCLIWYGASLAVLASVIMNDDPIEAKIGMALFISIFLLSGLIPFGMLLTLFFARARLQMRRDEVTGSIGFLFLRKKKTISTNSISDVGLASTNVRRSGEIQIGGNFGEMTGAMIKSSEFNMPLTMSKNARFNKQVAGLARFQLERLGVKLDND